MGVAETCWRELFSSLTHKTEVIERFRTAARVLGLIPNRK